MASLNNFDEGQMKALKAGFDHYGAFGDKNFTGNNMTLKNSDKWMKEAGVFKIKNISTTDTGIVFKQVVGNQAHTMTFAQFKDVVVKLADRADKDKGQSVLEKIMSALAKQATPETANATEASKLGVVDRLTDTTGYTGSHKERFDAEGKGKGLDGRENVAKNDGYVGNYKGAETYDAKHPNK